MNRLILCFDGTWNTPDSGKKPTNVVKLMRAIRKTDSGGTLQIAFYDAGVGTDGTRVSRAISGAFGRGLDTNVKDGYRFLAYNWQKGDEIYLFGFSRGAFTARSLAGFIDASGLLKKSEMEHLNCAWDLYRTPPKERTEKQIESIYSKGCTQIPIKCIGVWDTVGALGVPVETLQGFNRKYQFHNTELSDWVECAFHAVAIDEKRGPFVPTLWQKPKGEDLKNRIVEQVWFSGAHSNIGGSYEDDRLSDLALEWMVDRVRQNTGLEFDDTYLNKNSNGNYLGEIYESRSALYTVSRAYPFQRMIGQAEISGSFLRNLIKRRNHPDENCEYVNEMIHWSAKERFGKMAEENGKERLYEPANLKAAIEASVPIWYRDKNNRKVT